MPGVTGSVSGRCTAALPRLEMKSRLVSDEAQAIPIRGDDRRPWSLELVEDRSTGRDFDRFAGLGYETEIAFETEVD